MEVSYKNIAGAHFYKSMLITLSLRQTALSGLPVSRLGQYRLVGMRARPVGLLRNRRQVGNLDEVVHSIPLLVAVRQLAQVLLRTRGDRSRT